MDDEITAATFEQILETAKGSFRDLIESIYDQWETEGWLSPRQRQVLLNALERDSWR